MEKKEAKVIVKVIKGKCLGGYHKVGDVFEFKGDLIPGGICSGAMFSLLPIVLALQNEAKLRWEEDKDKAIIHCADEPGLVFEVRRIEEK